MKYVILIGDGMSDHPLEKLGGKTPLEYASTPNLDKLAGTGRFGLYATVPPGYPPGSDVANLSILGYDPAKYYTGRAPLEAASIGVKLSDVDVAFRCNLVTLAEKDGETIMDDYSAGHITTAEADEIIRTLSEALADEGVEFHTGTSYRHLMVWRDAPDLRGLETTPPHDISDKSVEGHLPDGPGSERLRSIMDVAREVLRDNMTNRRRLTAGNKPANAIWLWGQGTAPRMPTMKERFGVDGSIISAVDLMKGIGVYSGLEVLDVPGATGYIDTDYEGKVEAALKALEEKDFVVVHVEAPDEAGHNGSLEDKLTAIEDFDSRIVGPILKGLERYGEDFTVLALNDHPTPVALKTHTSEPVPFVLVKGASLVHEPGSAKFCEREAGETGLLVEETDVFISEFFGRPERVCDVS